METPNTTPRRPKFRPDKIDLRKIAVVLLAGIILIQAIGVFIFNWETTELVPTLAILVALGVIGERSRR